jgi:monoamine oxidase
MSSTYDCIVIGAGFAGLQAAHLLRKAGRKVLVLEARVRLGGRCQTGEYAGESFDFGGHWIGAHQPRVRRLISGQGLKFKAQYDEGIHVLRMFGTQHSYKGNISSLSALGEILAESGQLVQRWDADMLEVPLDDPTKCRHPEWDQITLHQWQQQNIKSREVELLMNFLVWTIFTVRAEEISYMWWLYYLRQGHGYAVLSDIRGGAQQDKVVGGLMQVCERLAKEIGNEHIKLRAPVQEVRQFPDSVEVSTPLGKFRAAYLIVTAPPAVCGDITWSPALPPQRMELFKRYLPGTVIKVYVCYKTWWWRQKGLSGEMLSDEEPVTLYYDATTEKLPALIGFIPAHLAKKWGSVSSAELNAAIIKQLVREFGPEAGNPERILTRPWLADDVWCKGAYAGSMGTNTLSKLGKELRRPIGRIHWAGTETALDWVGYFEGAVESGDRAAAEVLQLLQGKALAKL